MISCAQTQHNLSPQRKWSRSLSIPRVWEVGLSLERLENPTRWLIPAVAEGSPRVSGHPGTQYEIMSLGLRTDLKQNWQTCKWSHIYQEGCTENVCSDNY